MDSIADQTRLEELFRSHADDLRRYFARRHGGEQGVQDLVQETFLQLAKQSRRGSVITCARGYLFGIARRLSQAAWSERAHQTAVPFDAVVTDVPAPEADARVAAAQETISMLEPMQREILELRFAEGLAYAEIAEALQIPVGTVRSRLHHAVAEVRHRMEIENRS